MKSHLIFSSCLYRLKRLTPDKPVNMYQSHQQRYTSYTMGKPALKSTQTADDALARSLSNTFYITSYQSDIARHAGIYTQRPASWSLLYYHVSQLCSCFHSGKHQRSSSASMADSASTLTGQLESRRNSFSTESAELPAVRPARISSAPPTRSSHTRSSSYQLAVVNATEFPTGMQRRRSFSSLQRSYPSRGERLKEIFTVFPSPQPQPVSQRASRPSSAVTLRAGQIPTLRDF